MNLATKSAGIRVLVGVAAGSAVLSVSYCAFRLHFNLPTAGFLCLLLVVLTALKSGFWEATVASVAAVACLDYFFAPPIYSFHVADPENWVALVAFEVTALIICRLSNQVQEQIGESKLQRRNTEKLYELSRSLLVLNRQKLAGPKIASLIRNGLALHTITIFDAARTRLYTAGTCSQEDEEIARTAYLRSANSDELRPNQWQRVLRLESKPVGGLMVCGPELNALMVDAITSLVTACLDRIRSFEKESRAEAARQTEQLRTTVLDGLAHAFKTPLTVILTSTSGLLESRTLNPAQTELVELIDQHAIELNALATHLLRMAKLESAKAHLRPEELAIDNLIQEILQECAGQLNNHPVKVRIADEDLAVSADRRLLTITITEFLVNAAKYSSADSLITISAGRLDDRLLISVHNVGSSIDFEDRERIFDRFYRSPATKHRAPGSGIGLSVAKKTAEAHQGSIWVSSDEETGTTFFLSLPALARRECEPVAK